jgi:rsbT co-antagonist protein RsbR
MAIAQLTAAVVENEAALIQGWIAVIPSDNLMKADELKRQCTELLAAIRRALQAGGDRDIATPAWKETRDLLAAISASRAIQGFTPSATARFMLSLKEALFPVLRKRFADAHELNTGILQASQVMDSLSLFIFEAFMKTREDVIRRQQESMLELSTPVVKLWDGILALPLIGTLDSSRTQVVMESLLNRVVSESTEVVIIDITGVPTVDTLVAQHLLKTVTAARLMGTDCIISGIRPQIAQTIVHLGVDLTSVITKSSLADAFKVALTRRNLMVVSKRQAAIAGAPPGQPTFGS